MIELDGIRVGIDLVEIKRFTNISFQENKSFYEKNFSKDEIEYCLKFNEPYKHFAGKFALKEATKKALEIKLKMTEIITSHIKSKPIVIIPSEEYHLEASVSHDGDYAIAILISKKVV